MREGERERGRENKREKETKKVNHASLASAFCAVYYS